MLTDTKCTFVWHIQFVESRWFNCRIASDWPPRNLGDLVWSMFGTFHRRPYAIRDKFDASIQTKFVYHEQTRAFYPTNSVGRADAATKYVIVSISAKDKLHIFVCTNAAARNTHIIVDNSFRHKSFSFKLLAMQRDLMSNEFINEIAQLEPNDTRCLSAMTWLKLLTYCAKNEYNFNFRVSSLCKSWRRPFEKIMQNENKLKTKKTKVNRRASMETKRPELVRLWMA